jgi:hypothetical protein
VTEKGGEDAGVHTAYQNVHKNHAVLPGLVEALPPFEPKFTAIWRKHSDISHFKKFRYFSAIFFSYPNC